MPSTGPGAPTLTPSPAEPPGQAPPSRGPRPHTPRRPSSICFFPSQWPVGPRRQHPSRHLSAACLRFLPPATSRSLQEHPPPCPSSPSPTEAVSKGGHCAVAAWSLRQIPCPTPSVSPGPVVRSGRTCPGPGLGEPQACIEGGEHVFTGYPVPGSVLTALQALARSIRTEPERQNKGNPIISTSHVGKQTRGAEQVVCSTSQRVSGSPCTASRDRREGDRRERLSFLSPATASACQSASLLFWRVPQNFPNCHARKSHCDTRRVFGLSPQIAVSLARTDSMHSLMGQSPWQGANRR